MKNFYRQIFIVFIALFIINASAEINFAEAANLKNHPEIIKTGDDKFDRAFREGRDLIDKEQWKEAAEKFKEIVCDCPEKKGVDAALYWLAFTYKKQKMYAEMNDALNRLQKNFPNSSWADDARVLRMQQSENIIFTEGLSDNAITIIGTPINSQSNAPLDREEEIKLAAFQSLLASDPKRGVEILGDVLLPDSKTSENLQIQMLRAAGNSAAGRFSFRYFIPSASTVIGSDSVMTTTVTTNSNQTPAEEKAALVSQLRQVLMNSYKTAASVRVKSEIINLFGGTEESANFLVSLYSTETDKQIKTAVIRALSGIGFSSVYLPTNRDALRKSNFDKLLGIYKNERDADLRAVILGSLQRFKGWSQNESLFQTLMQSYEAETDDKTKTSIIALLGRTKSAQAIAKLMDIAKNDKSDKMRLEALRALRGSNDPQVIKFLEGLIK